MKKAYSKPMIYVEVMELDQPIAGTCSADKSDMIELTAQGWFTEARQCNFKLTAENPTVQNGSDTICYNSNVLTAFTS